MNWKKILMYSGLSLAGIAGIMLLMALVNYMFPMNIFINLGIQLLLVIVMLILMFYQSVRTTEEKWIVRAFAIVAWLIIVWFAYGSKLFPSKAEVKVETVEAQPTNDELANANAQWANAISERDNAQSELSGASERIDSLQKALNKCKGIKEKLTPEEELALLRKENAALRKGPKKVTFAAEPEDVTEEKFTNIKFGQPAPTITSETYDADGTSLPITQYEGEIKGDFWVTIDGQGHLLYALKASAWPITQAPRLNFENGPEFTLDSQSGYWYYVDLSRLVSVQEINKKYAEWNVFIGLTNYGTGSYPTFLPHQSLKPLINKVRGKEWGEISDSDLIQMRKENKNIWTPEAEGGLIPFRLDATNGRALGKEDRNLYQGWNFRNIIFAKRKTTIQ